MAGYTLEGVLVHVRPTPGHSFPVRVGRIFLFAQLHGTPGEYTIRVRFGRVVLDEEGEVSVSADGEYGPWDIELPGINYVEGYGIPLSDLPIPEPGVYEFQLWVDGQDDMMMNERIEARE